MSAKVELEAFVNEEHPHPEFLHHHISLCETSVKQLASERHRLVADGVSHDGHGKDFYSSSVKNINGHAETSLKAGAHPDVTTGIVFCIQMMLCIFTGRQHSLLCRCSVYGRDVCSSVC